MPRSRKRQVRALPAQSVRGQAPEPDPGARDQKGTGPVRDRPRRPEGTGPPQTQSLVATSSAWPGFVWRTTHGIIVGCSAQWIAPADLRPDGANLG